MPSLNLSMRVDITSDVAYIRFSDAPVARTCEASDEVQVDLDEFGMAVGVEILDLQAEIPFQDLVTRFHVPEAAVDMLRQIRPSVSGFMTLTRGGDGTLIGPGVLSAA